MIVQSMWVSRIWSDGQHNAFPGIARYGDWYYVACRRSDGHQSPKASIVVIRSSASDLRRWQQVAEVDIGGDSRDPFVCVVGDYVHVYWHRDPSDWAICSRDGETWAEPREVQPEFPTPPRVCDLAFTSKRTWHFRIRRGPDGAYYSLARCGVASNGEAGVLLYRSTDGLSWQALHTFGEGIQKKVTAGHEADLAFLDDGRVVAAVRCQQARGGGEGLIAWAEPPYLDWAWYWAGVRNFGGPALWRTPSGLIVGARQMEHHRAWTGRVWEVTPRALVTSYVVPMGGDCAYQCFEDGPDDRGNLTLMVYYSSHEHPGQALNKHPADLYLARLDIVSQSSVWN